MSLPDLSFVADRRAHEAPTGGVRRGEEGQVAAPRTMGRAQAETLRRPKEPVLTTREERVRRLLMRELNGLNQRLNMAKTWAEKKERERLAKLDVSYIDAEIAKMQKQLETPWAMGGLLLASVVLVGVVLGVSTSDPDFKSPWGHVLNLAIFLLNAGVTGWAYWQHREALRRKLYIYEALRALSDADELDVLLSRATEQADALIARIVSAELAAEKRRPGLSLALSEIPEDLSSRPRARVR